MSDAKRSGRTAHQADGCMPGPRIRIMEMMMNHVPYNPNNGVTFIGLLTLLFIGLKLTGNIDWSWWLVLSPILSEFIIIVIRAIYNEMFR